MRCRGVARSLPVGTARRRLEHPLRCTAATPGGASSNPCDWRTRRPPPAGGAVREDDAAQFDRPARCVHRPGEALAHQPRQVTAVVDVGVGQHNSIQGRRRHRERRPVAQPELLHTLVQTAVEEHARLIGLDEKPAPSDGAGPTEEGDRGFRSHPADGAPEGRPATRAECPMTAGNGLRPEPDRNHTSLGGICPKRRWHDEPHVPAAGRSAGTFGPSVSGATRSP
jgi:hypothetical protein